LLYPLEHPLVEQNVDLAFEMTTSSQSSTELIERQVADDFRCVGQSPVTSAVWWGSYLGHYYKPCECWSPFPPVRPDYFLLSIWENIPDPDPEDPATFSQPGQRLWTYRAESFDEVLVGYDKHPEFDFHEGRAEAVYRYSVKLPRDDWFWQSSEQDVYWFSIVAVYDRNVTALEYPWGWTNHAHVYQDNAVAGQSPSGVPSGDDLVWEPLYDQTQSDQDMSFMLFTDPNAVLLPPIDPPIPPDPPIDPPLPPNPPIPPVDPLS
jgi:hypothetical protein